MHYFKYCIIGLSDYRDTGVDPGRVFGVSRPLSCDYNRTQNNDLSQVIFRPTSAYDQANSNLVIIMSTLNK